MELQENDGKSKKTLKRASINDKTGKRVNKPEEIKKVHLDYYKELLTIKPAETKEESIVEDTVNRCINTMKQKSNKIEIKPITDKEYEDMKVSLDNNKAPDMEGWFYEMVKNAGKDLEESIKMMIRTMTETKEIADEWNKMSIHPKDKNAGWLEMSNKRGLFLTNIISKCVEKILFKRNENTLIKHLSPYSNGGIKERGIQDNLFVVNYMINKYRKARKNLYLLFADIEKCFDNLWLRDCILELVRCGVPVEESMYILQMNEYVLATVKTPVGDTEEIKLNEIVKQGTVGGCKLCVVSTDRINKMGSYNEPDGIRFPIFVDDKLGMGNIKTIEEMNWRMNTLEVTKKYKYNNKVGKTEWMVIRNDGKKTNMSEPNLEVKGGKIGRAYKYKYHGDMYNDTGTNESKIEHKENKIQLMINDVKAQSNQKKVGRAALPVRLMLIEAIITLTILSSTSTSLKRNNKK